MINNRGKRLIHLKNGQIVERVIKKNKDGRTYIRYNGRSRGVAFYCGYWCEIYD